MRRREQREMREEEERTVGQMGMGRRKGQKEFGEGS